MKEIIKKYRVNCNFLRNYNIGDIIEYDNILGGYLLCFIDDGKFNKIYDNESDCQRYILPKDFVENDDKLFSLICDSAEIRDVNIKISIEKIGNFIKDDSNWLLNNGINVFEKILNKYDGDVNENDIFSCTGAEGTYSIKLVNKRIVYNKYKDSFKISFDAIQV